MTMSIGRKRMNGRAEFGYRFWLAIFFAAIALRYARQGSFFWPLVASLVAIVLGELNGKYIASQKAEENPDD